MIAANRLSQSRDGRPREQRSVGSNRPIDFSPVQLPSKMGQFYIGFRELSRVRSTESSGFMERAMGIEPTSEAWEASILPLYDARSGAFCPLL